MKELCSGLSSRRVAGNWHPNSQRISHAPVYCLDKIVCACLQDMAYVSKCIAFIIPICYLASSFYVDLAPHATDRRSR